MAQRGGYKGGFRGGRNRPSPYGRQDRQKPWRNRGQDGPSPDKMNRSWDKDAGPSDHEPPVPPSAREQPQEQGREHALGEARREKKFSNKARLFVGNLPRDFSEQQLKELFQESGEVQEVFLNKEKNFGFVRMAYRSDAEKAISANHGKVIKNRDIKVRFAASSCSVKVSNLHPLVSNELLADAFSMFGEVENAVVVTDDRGKSLGYGIVEFARKNQAIAAIQKCKLENFLLTKTPIPVLVTEHTKDNDEEGQPEKSLPRNATFFSEREAPPRFAQPGSLEYDVAGRWKAHYDSEKMQREELEQRLKEGRNLLQQDMHNIKEQHQTLLLRQEIARHQQEQLRLAEELRKQEERMQGYYSQGGPQYHPGVNPMPAGSLVMPGAAVGGVEAGGENVATELMAIPTAMGGGIRPPATGAMPLFPSPLMGKDSVHPLVRNEVTRHAAAGAQGLRPPMVPPNPQFVVTQGSPSFTTSITAPIVANWTRPPFK